MAFLPLHNFGIVGVHPVHETQNRHTREAIEKCRPERLAAKIIALDNANIAERIVQRSRMKPGDDRAISLQIPDHVAARFTSYEHTPGQIFKPPLAVIQNRQCLGQVLSKGREDQKGLDESATWDFEG